MKKYRDIMDEIYEDRKPSKKEKRIQEQSKRDKRINNALRSNRIDDLIIEDDDEDWTEY